MSEQPLAYEPREVEDRLYRFWEEGGYFGAHPNPERKPFTIVIPPPNITGVLHLGHGLDETLQDVLIRWRRMQGYEALWIPGTDHAGIATQNVVERQLAKEGLTRQDLGREAFVARVWEWREKYGDAIIAQLKRLGASCDWSRLRFTMDPGLSAAVRRVFVMLYNEGLIYRGNRIINWCPRCGTAIADVELDHGEHQGELVEFRYLLADEGQGPGEISVATTRLETMLGDVAIAVNPDDPRYADRIGRRAVHPFDGRLLPIVADPAVDPAFGTGAVKITPAHDQTDFEIAARHNLERINILDGQARINEHGGRFAGLDRYQAREAVREALREKGLLVGSTPHSYAIARCARCQTVVEPWLSEQWFVRMEPLARPAIAAVEEGRTRFYPERWTRFYLNWMEQIRDWCISRQLWWGHRIPVFTCDNCGEVWAAEEDPEACRRCGTASPRQDPDVLDTWFSSQLWPFSTLGWPEKTPDLDYFYPTAVLVTGYEIIHLWVARMIMSGLYCMGDVPFSWVYVHGIVRDAQGRKMSKSLGNVIDPLELMDRYGTDALRFMLAEHATGQDIFLNEEWTAGARNFANKLWNASRFVIMNLSGTRADFSLPDRQSLTIADRWVLSRLNATIGEVTANLEGFEISAAAKALYAFVWNEFCDWYLEAAKTSLREDATPQQAAARQVLAYALAAILRLLHPFMPFITEEIWQRLPGAAEAAGDPSIMRGPWPEPRDELADPAAEQDFRRLQEVVSALRSFRAGHRLEAGAQLAVNLSAADPAALQALAGQGDALAALGRVSEISFSANGRGPADPGPSTRLVAGPVDIVIPLAGVLDLEAERDRLRRALEKIRAEEERFEAKLGNAGFRGKAPADVVAGEERKLAEARATRAKLEGQLGEIDG